MTTLRTGTAGRPGELVGNPLMIGLDQADGDSQMRRVVVDLERLAWCGADALSSQSDQRRTFVGN